MRNLAPEDQAEELANPRNCLDALEISQQGEPFPIAQPHAPDLAGIDLN